MHILYKLRAVKAIRVVHVRIIVRNEIAQRAENPYFGNAPRIGGVKREHEWLGCRSFPAAADFQLRKSEAPR